MDTTPSAPSIAVPARGQHDARMRMGSAIALAVSVIVAGVRAGVLLEEEDRGPTNLFIGVAMSFFVASWCWFDSRVRGKPIARAVAMLLLLGTVIAFPIYCVWSRGARGLLLLLLAVIAFLFLSVLSAMVAALIVHGSAAFTPP
jgi:hypothetical protein